MKNVLKKVTAVLALTQMSFGASAASLFHMDVLKIQVLLSSEIVESKFAEAHPRLGGNIVALGIVAIGMKSIDKVNSLQTTFERNLFAISFGMPC